MDRQVAQNIANGIVDLMYHNRLKGTFGEMARIAASHRNDIYRLQLMLFLSHDKDYGCKLNRMPIMHAFTETEYMNGGRQEKLKKIMSSPKLMWYEMQRINCEV